MSKKDGRGRAWSLAPGVELPGARARQRVRVESVEGDAAEISYVDLRTRERRQEIVSTEDLVEEEMPRGGRRPRRKRVANGRTDPVRAPRQCGGPWSAAEVAAAYALGRAGIPPSRIRDALLRLFGTDRTSGAVGKVTSAIRCGTERSELMERLVLLATDDPERRPGEPLPDDATVRLGRVPGVPVLRPALCGLGADPEDLAGEPDPATERSMPAPEQPEEAEQPEGDLDSLAAEHEETVRTLADLRQRHLDLAARVSALEAAAGEPAPHRAVAVALLRALRRACAGVEAAAEAHLDVVLNDPTYPATGVPLSAGEVIALLGR